MTDELTPEQKEALKNLPRERVPVGLESRVVDAMREHGFLEKRRRTIAVTNTRVAGLVAACAALVIGAYAIGFHAGGGPPALPPVGIVPPQERATKKTPEVAESVENRATESAHEKSAPPSTPSGAGSQEAAADRLAAAGGKETTTGKPEAPKPAEQKKAAADETATGKTEATQPPAARPEKAGGGAEAGATDQAARIAAKEGAPTSRQGGVVPEQPIAPQRESAPVEMPKPTAAPQPAFEKSARRIQSAQPGAAMFSRNARTFTVDGRSFVVEAPDSVRVVTDQRGRMLLIYTSDGVIRIRLGDRR